MTLRSRDHAFGGYSAMLVEGDRFTLVSDGGNILRFRLDSQFQLSEVSVGDLPGGPGTGWQKHDRDSEAMTIDPETGQIWVSFERYNMIWRYAPGLVRAERWAAPPAMADWSPNGGAESMVRLHNGRFLVISEKARPKGNPKGREAFAFTTDPTVAPHRGFPFIYTPPEGYDPVEMIELPDQRLLILNRRFSLPGLFSNKLVVVDGDAVKPGATVEGEEILNLASPLIHDNFEAMAVSKEGKDLILWLASDDNQQFWERSYVLKFRLKL